MDGGGSCPCGAPIAARRGMVKRTLAYFALINLVCVAVGCTRSSDEWQATLPLVPAEQLTRTVVLPYSSGPIEQGQNYVYCATFQMAWDELQAQMGNGPIRLAGDPPMVGLLNGQPFNRSDLDPESCLAMAGRTDQEIVDRIHEAMAARFPHATLDVPIPPARASFYLYAYLAKNLLFDQPFDVAEWPSQFPAGAGLRGVASFYANFHKADRKSERLRKQVTILDYKSNDNFVLRLDTAAKDELILAKVPPKATLADTIDVVGQRIGASQTTGPPEFGEYLQVPMIELGVERRYETLMDKRFLAPIDDELYIAQAEQAIRFELNERGARVESRADVSTKAESKIADRRFIFDQPFLLYLKEPGGTAPYFAMWIANDELLKKFARK